jgi:hypothetical protein
MAWSKKECGMGFQWPSIENQTSIKQFYKRKGRNQDTALLKLNHPNVIKLFHADGDQDFK